MFKALRGRCKVATVGAENPTSSNACHTADNHYVACPDRPGIAKGTFDFAAIENVVKAIKSTGCGIVYFESVHLWNCFILMRLGKDYVRCTTLCLTMGRSRCFSAKSCNVVFLTMWS